MNRPAHSSCPGRSGLRRTLTSVLASVVLCVLAPAAELSARQSSDAPVDFTNLDALAWLVGTWGNDNTLEHWTNGDGGLMLGVHRDLRDGRASFFEFLRIALTRDGGVVYLASPAGRNPPTVFPLTEIGEDHAVFSNPDHDYPQRIDYSLEDGDLVVTISKADQSDQRTWRWQRLGDG